MAQIKCIIWDLDNTIWDGILMENNDIRLKPGIKDLLQYFDERGILNSIASNNNPDTAIRKLKGFDIYHYFLFPQCSWSPKSQMIHKIMYELGILPDNVAFIDDDNFHLNEVKYSIDKINVYSANDYLKLKEYQEFQVISISEDSKNRRKYILSANTAKEEMSKFKGTPNDFIKYSEMELSIFKANIDNIDRVSELAYRTNRFNNLKEKLNTDTIIKYISDPDKHTFYANLKDRFGEYGTIATCMLQENNNYLYLKNVCVSCRVAGRGLATVFLKSVLCHIHSKSSNFSSVLIDYYLCDANKEFLLMLKILGFKHKISCDDKSTFELNLPIVFDDKSYVNIQYGC